MGEKRLIHEVDGGVAQRVVLTDSMTGEPTGGVHVRTFLWAGGAETTGAPAVSAPLPGRAPATYQAALTAGTGAAATVRIMGSNNGITFLDLLTIELSGDAGTSDGAAIDAPWAHVIAVVDSISGDDSPAVAVYAGG